MADSIDFFLCQWLAELVFLKDASVLLLKYFKVRIEQNTSFQLEDTVFGEEIDPTRYQLTNDVKIVTLHPFKIEKKQEMEGKGDLRYLIPHHENCTN